MDNINLIGYRCSGKSSVGRQLAEVLQRPFVDADLVFVEQETRSVADFVAVSGWPEFRRLESSILSRLCRKQKIVLATGGGAPMRQESCRTMRDGGTVVWLIAEPETILARMHADSTTAARRPNLTDRGPLEEIVHLLAAREPIYRRTAHLVVDTEGKTPKQLADEIIVRLEISGNEGTPA